MRDFCQNPTNEGLKTRQGVKGGTEDSLRIVRKVLANPSIPAAFKRTDGWVGPDDTELLG